MKCSNCGFDPDIYKALCLPIGDIDTYHASFARLKRRLDEIKKAEKRDIEIRFKKLLQEQTDLYNQGVELGINKRTLYDLGKLHAQQRREFWKEIVSI